MATERVFITGGAGGFGLALATRFAKDGAHVCISDVRDHLRDEALAQINAAGAASSHYLTVDVRSESQMKAAADWVVENWGGVDVVINNAGVAISGPIHECSEEDWQWIVDINLHGVARGCRVFTPILLAQKSGHIVNIASMAGLIHPPLMSAYNATKAAVVALSETMFFELQPHGIHVSVVCPSFFKTGIADAARTSNPEVHRTTSKLVNKSRFTAEAIANLTVEGVRRKRFYVLTHTDGKAAFALKRTLPFRQYAALIANRTRAMTR